MESVHVSVSKILGAEPDPSIPANIWQELIKLRLAMLNLADAVDARNAAIATQAATSPEETTGLLTHSMHLGLLTTVKIAAGETIAASPSVFCRFAAFGSQLRAYLVRSELIDAVSVVSAAATPAGSQRDFILRGLYLNGFETQTQLSSTGNVPHSRLASVDFLKTALYDYFKGTPNWRSDAWATYGYTARGLNYAGHIIGSMVAESNQIATPGIYFLVYAKNALVYFNPRRA